MNSRFHGVLKLKPTASSEYSSRILATKKRPENTLKICRHHRNSCTYPHCLQPYLDLSPFVLQEWTKGLVFICLKNSYITFFVNSSYKMTSHLMMKKLFYPYNIKLSGIQTSCFQSTGHGNSNFNLGHSALLQNEGSPSVKFNQLAHHQWC